MVNKVKGSIDINVESNTMDYSEAMKKAFKLGKGHPFTNVYEYSEKFPHLKRLAKQIKRGGMVDIIVAFETGQKNSDLIEGTNEKLN
jgi:hypothetical protein